MNKYFMSAFSGKYLLVRQTKLSPRFQCAILAYSSGANWWWMMFVDCYEYAIAIEAVDVLH